MPCKWSEETHSRNICNLVREWFFLGTIEQGRAMTYSRMMFRQSVDFTKPIYLTILSC